MDDDPHAFCYEIENDAVTAFDKAGLAAFEKQVRARFEAAAKDPSTWEYRQASGILRAIYCAQRDVQAYVTLTEQTGVKPEDCLAVAKLIATQKPDEALAWAERGRALDREKQFRSTARVGSVVISLSTVAATSSRPLTNAKHSPSRMNAPGWSARSISRSMGSILPRGLGSMAFGSVHLGSVHLLLPLSSPYTMWRYAPLEDRRFDCSGQNG
jgi:hypothetical protein